MHRTLATRPCGLYIVQYPCCKDINRYCLALCITSCCEDIYCCTICVIFSAFRMWFVLYTLLRGYMLVCHMYTVSYCKDIHSCAWISIPCCEDGFSSVMSALHPVAKMFAALQCLISYLATTIFAAVQCVVYSASQIFSSVLCVVHLL
jgi:hypothetical protein